MEYLKIWTNFVECMEPLNDSEKGRLFVAMLEYASEGKLPELKGNERFTWPTAKQSIDRARAESNRQTANGSKGGRPKKNPENRTVILETQQNPTKPTETQQNPKYNIRENNIRENNIKEKGKKESCRFLPPTVDDVKAYCQERNSTVDAERFVDFYSSKGWKVGSQPMKDWKAAVRTWEKRDGGKTVSAQAYSQRNYTEDALNAVGDDLMAEIRRGRMA